MPEQIETTDPDPTPTLPDRELTAEELKFLEGLEGLDPVIGTFVAALCARYEDIKEDHRLLTAEAEELKLDNHRLHEESHTDEQTGLPNERAMMKWLANEVESGTKNLTVAFIDLDRFKEINDLFGHPIGNEAIKKMGAVMQGIFLEIIETNTRSSSDVKLARLHGDEFMLAFKGLPEKRIHEICDLVLDSIRSIGIAKDGSLIDMTDEVKVDALNLDASLGLSKYILGEDIQDTIARADKEMRNNKQDKQTE